MKRLSKKILKNVNVNLATEETIDSLSANELLNKNVEHLLPTVVYTGTPTEIKEKLKNISIKIIKVLDSVIYITKYCPTILRIGHLSKSLEGSPEFLKFNKKEQEFTVKVTSNLVTDEPSELKRYCRADVIALKYMIKRYPKTPISFWIKALSKVLGKTATTDLNIGRHSNLSLKIIKLSPPKKKASKKVIKNKKK